MENEAFWRERGIRFRALATPRLHAIRSDADVEQLLDDLREQLLYALNAPDDPIENVRVFRFPPRGRLMGAHWSSRSDSDRRLRQSRHLGVDSRRLRTRRTSVPGQSL